MTKIESCPGFRVVGGAAIYGGGPIEKGPELWELFLTEVRRAAAINETNDEVTMHVWLEFGDTLSHRVVDEEPHQAQAIS